ncbi:MAG TPA: polysaccharide deacetylase family protein [Gemmatimonadaceae bacterium]
MRLVHRIACVLLMLSAGCHAAQQASTSRVAPRVPDKLVVLTFDDAVRSHYTTVAPLLERYGFGATFFVTEFPQPPFSDTTLYMTWPQMGDLSRRGFEVANHTWKHSHVDRIDRARLVEEVRYIEQKLASLGAPRPISFAYPAYTTTPDAARTLRELGYVFARTGGNRAYDPVHDDPMLVPSWTTGEKNREEILRAFSEARDGRIVVLTIHGVPDTAHPWVNTPVPLFEEYLRFLHDNGYKVVALRDVARYLPASH